MRLPDKRCIVLDMDGTIYMGDNPIEGAVAFVQRHWEDVDFFFLSNNTSKAPETYIKKLNGMGIPARREQLLSPVTPLVAFLKAEGIHTAYVVGNRDFVSDLRQRMPELKQQEEGAQAVILAYDTELTYEKLSRSALLLENHPEVLFLATHPDKVCPSPEGPLPDVPQGAAKKRHGDARSGREKKTKTTPDRGQRKKRRPGDAGGALSRTGRGQETTRATPAFSLSGTRVPQEQAAPRSPRRSL